MKISLKTIVFILLVIGAAWLYPTLKQRAADIIDQSLKTQTAAFVSLSVLKSSIDIIEGSSVQGGWTLGLNVTADVEVGDVAQSLYDFVDFAWTLSLYGLLIGTFYKIILAVNLTDLGLYCGAFGLLMYLVGLLGRRREGVIRFGKIFFTAGVLVAVFIPAVLLISFHGADYLAQSIQKNIDRDISNLGRRWEGIKERLSLAEVRDSFHQAAAGLKDLLVDMVIVFLQYTCVLILKFFLFPFVTMYLLYQTLAVVLAGWFGGNTARLTAPAAEVTIPAETG